MTRGTVKRRQDPSHPAAAKPWAAMDMSMPVEESRPPESGAHPANLDNICGYFMGMGISTGPSPPVSEFAARVAAHRGAAAYSPRGDKVIVFPKGRKASKVSHLSDRGLECPAGVTFSAVHEALVARVPPHLRKERPQRVPKPLLIKINAWKRVLAGACADPGAAGAPASPAERFTALAVEALRGGRDLPRDLARVQEGNPGVAEAASRLLFPFRDSDGALSRTEIEGLPEGARRLLDGWLSPTDLRTGEDSWFPLVYPGRAPSEVSIDWDLEDLTDALLGDPEEAPPCDPLGEKMYREEQQAA